MARILVAEDDRSLLSFLQMALEKAGHQVTTADNGSDALLILQKSSNNFDLLLSDIIMPGIDGIELSQRAVQLCPDLKVMFITGFSAVSVGQNAAQLSQAKILSKPFHLNDLVANVETLLAA